MNLQAQTIIPVVGAVVVHYRGSNPPMDSIYVAGKEVARIREEALPDGGSFFVALDLEESEARAFTLGRDPWAEGVEWLLRRNGCSNTEIAQAVLDYEKAEAEWNEVCDARR